MRVIRRLAAPVLLVLALAASATPVDAYTIYCEDWCCNSDCGRPCWTYDPVLTNCGAYGMCYGSPACSSPSPAAATADFNATTSPLVCSETASDAPPAPPAPAEPAD